VKARAWPPAAPPAAAIHASVADTVTWSYRPWREAPRRAALALGSFAALALLLAFCGLPMLMYVALVVVLLQPFASAFALSSSYRVTSEGVGRWLFVGWEMRPWQEIRRIDEVEVGLLVSPRRQRNWLDATRGLTLPMPGESRQELSALVRTRWAAATQQEPA